MRGLWSRFGDLFKEVITPTVVFGWLVTSVVVAIAGPFGTFESQAFPTRLAYWSAVIGVSIPIAFACRVFWLQFIKGDPAWLEDTLVIGTMALIFGPTVVAFNIWLSGPEIESVMSWPMATLVTFFVGIGIVIMRRWMQQTPTVVAAPVPQRDRLLDRIDAPEGVRLVRVSSDNHHIRVTTDDGKEHRVLMRLRDAVAEITYEEGLCVHRSHWLAVAHIERIEDQSGKEIIVTPCGAEIPVGPKYRPDLVERGVLAA